TRHHHEVIEPTGLKLTLDCGRQAVLAAEHHSHDQTLRGAVIAKGCLEPVLDPTLNTIETVPAASLNRDQAGGSDVAGPVDVLAREVAAKIKHAGISINRRTMQFSQVFDSISGPEVECVEHRELLRIVQKLR